MREMGDHKEAFLHESLSCVLRDFVKRHSSHDLREGEDLGKNLVGGR